jgi:putative ABC transport system permease protein
MEGLAQVEGVARVERGAFVVIGNKARSLVGAIAFTDPWLDEDPAAGVVDRDRLAAGEVTIGPALARSEGLRPGDVLDLATPTGTAHLPIMGVVYNGNFGGRNVQMSYALLEELYGPQPPVNVVVVPEAGVSEAELVRRIEAAELDPGIEVRPRQEIIDINTDEVAEQLSTFDAIQRGLLVMSFIAVLSTLVLVGVQRRREMGMLAAVGMTPSELRRMVLSEAGIVALLGVVVTGVMAVVQLWALLAITPVVIGYKDPFVPDFVAMARYGVIALGVALVAALYPARRAARVEVLDALRYE